MEFWPTLLIALIPAVLAFLASWFLAKQNAKSESHKIWHQYKLESVSYVTRTKFDGELAAYHTLTKTLSLLLRMTGELFPNIKFETRDSVSEEYKVKLYHDAQTLTDDTLACLWEKALYMPQSWHERFYQLIDRCRQQKNLYHRLFIKRVDDDEKRLLMYMEARDCKEEILRQYDDLIKDLRLYINKLQVHI